MSKEEILAIFVVIMFSGVILNTLIVTFLVLTMIKYNIENRVRKIRKLKIGK